MNVELKNNGIIVRFSSTCFETHLETDGSVIILKNCPMFMINIQKQLKIKTSKTVNCRSPQNIYFRILRHLEKKPQQLLDIP